MPIRCRVRMAGRVSPRRRAGWLLAAMLVGLAGCSRQAIPPPESRAPGEVVRQPPSPAEGNAAQTPTPTPGGGNLPSAATAPPTRRPASAKPIFPTGQRETRDTILCQANLKQLAMAMLMYAEDHEERLPPADRWETALRPYVRTAEVFHCPDAPGGRHGYAFHRRLAGKRISEIWQPESVVLLFETKRQGANVADNGESWVGARHGNFGHVAYLDGRVVTSPTRPDFRLKQ